MIKIAEHPLLDVAVIQSQFSHPLGDLETPAEIFALLSLTVETPMSTNDDVKKAVRDLLRQGGYKPTGRGKPSSEYLVKAVGEGRPGSINPAVDVCNIISLHSGLPISVVDLDRVTEPLKIDVAEDGAEYIFNASGQTISLGGLLCLFDAQGPCGNGVKDSQRTKTSDRTRRTLSVIWGTHELAERTARATEWYVELLRQCDADVDVTSLQDRW